MGAKSMPSGASPTSTSYDLMKRNHNLTLDEFSESWYKDRGTLIVPYFLHSGVTYYAQIHAPLSTSSTDINIGECTPP
ncbi:hypothetical protein BDZ45DRAFT_752928 [Acephala macrosclerotiorum]|nr:hypothetical protein BDZ45DRAFT_752928 [Acephala macrosclerotiorum]